MSSKTECPNCSQEVTNLKRHLKQGCRPITCSRCGLQVAANDEKHNESCRVDYNGAKFVNMYRWYSNKNYFSIVQCQFDGKLVSSSSWKDHIKSKTHKKAMEKGVMAIESLNKKQKECQIELEKEYGKGEQRKHSVFHHIKNKKKHKNNRTKPRNKREQECK